MFITIFFLTRVIPKHFKLSVSHMELHNSCPKFACPLQFPPLVNQLNIQAVNLLGHARNLEVIPSSPPSSYSNIRFVSYLSLSIYHFSPLSPPCVVLGLLLALSQQ